jgi:hypothetical protein
VLKPAVFSQKSRKLIHQASGVAVSCTCRSSDNYLGTARRVGCTNTLTYFHV